MLHVENLVLASGSATQATYMPSPSSPKHHAAASTRLIEMSFRAVELDGRNLWREPEDVAVGQLAEAIRLADLRGKPELKINNITPWIAVGNLESRQIPIIQKKIEHRLASACKQIRRPVPDSRLDLTHGVYGIRCYLGRTKPTDHVHDEDLLSDSR